MRGRGRGPAVPSCCTALSSLSPATCSSLVFLVVHCTRFLPCKNSRSQRHGQVLRPSSSGPCSSKTTCDPPCEQRWGEVRPGRRAFPWLSLPSCSTGPSPRSGPRPRQCCSLVRPVHAIIVPRPRRRLPHLLIVIVVGCLSSSSVPPHLVVVVVVPASLALFRRGTRPVPVVVVACPVIVVVVVVSSSS